MVDESQRSVDRELGELSATMTAIAHAVTDGFSRVERSFDHVNEQLRSAAADFHDHVNQDNERFIDIDKRFGVGERKAAWTAGYLAGAALILGAAASIIVPKLFTFMWTILSAGAASAFGR